MAWPLSANRPQPLALQRVVPHDLAGLVDAHGGILPLRVQPRDALGVVEVVVGVAVAIGAVHAASHLNRVAGLEPADHVLLGRGLRLVVAVASQLGAGGSDRTSRCGRYLTRRSSLPGLPWLIQRASSTTWPMMNSQPARARGSRIIQTARRKAGHQRRIERDALFVDGQGKRLGIDLADQETARFALLEGTASTTLVQPSSAASSRASTSSSGNWANRAMPRA